MLNNSINGREGLLGSRNSLILELPVVTLNAYYMPGLGWTQGTQGEVHKLCAMMGQTWSWGSEKYRSGKMVVPSSFTETKNGLRYKV